MWYEWRVKLLEGLREGLDRHVQGMDADDLKLRHEESLLRPMVEGLVGKRDELTDEVRVLREREEEAEGEDLGEKQEAREMLEDVEAQLTDRKQYLQQLEQLQKDNQSKIVSSREMRVEYEAQIKEAERVREECRGWSASEAVDARGMSPSPHRKKCVQDLANMYGPQHQHHPSPNQPAGPSSPPHPPQTSILPTQTSAQH